MPSYKDSRSGITRGWNAGEDGWGSAVNESLQQIAYVGTHPLVKGQLSSPPASPTLGDAYIVGSSPTGAWSTFTETHIALWGRQTTNYASSAWLTFAPLEGWVFYRADTDQLVAYSGTAWGNVGSSTYKGAWAAGVYAVGDIARDGNNFYIAKTARVASNTSRPSADAEWLLLTAAGSATGNYKGAWAAGTFAVGDVVSYLGNFYVARTARTTTDTSNPTLDAEWLILTAAGANNDNYRGDWSADAYSVGDIVRYSNRFFIARVTRSATDTTVPTLDANWLDITAPASGTSYKGVWSAGDYNVGDIVRYSNRFFICGQMRTAANTLIPPAALSGWFSLVYNAQLDPVAETTMFGDNLRFTIGTSANQTEYITGANLKAGIAGNYRGAWRALMAYSIGDIVSYGTSFFVARTARPPSSSTVPTSDPEWLDIASSGNTIYKGTYMGGTAYGTGDLVVRGGAFFLARQGNTDANFRPDHWLALGDMTTVTAEHLRVTNNTIIKTLNQASTTKLPPGSDAAYTGTIQSGMIHGGMFGPRGGGLLNLPTGTNKFWRYVVDVGNAYFTDLTITGTNTSNYRAGHAMVGDEDRGLVFGGEDSTGTLNTMTSYVRTSGTVALATMAVSTAGANGTPARTLHTMVGNRFNGMIFGGIVNNVATNSFVYYEASENVVTYYNMTVNGTIAARRNHVMVGNADEGIIYGGDWQSTFSDFVYYRRSGTTVTVTTLTQLGYNLAGRTEAMMVGDVNSGILFGGNDGTVRNTFVAYRRDSDSIILTLQTNVGSIRMLEGSIMIGDAAAGILWAGDDPTDARDTLYTYDRRVSTEHYRGDWSANTSYAVGDLVTRNSIFYLCLTANSDSTFTPSKWVAIGQSTYKGIHSRTSSYGTGDIVQFGASFYQSKEAHAARAWDPSQWNLLSPEPPAAQRLRLSDTATVAVPTKVGTILGRELAGIAGNSQRGIIYGGDDGYGSGAATFMARNNWNEYVVDAGNVYFQQLTTTGATSVPRYSFAMVGDENEGLSICGAEPPAAAPSNTVIYYIRVLANGQPTNQLRLTNTTTASGTLTGRAGHGAAGDSSRGLIFGGSTTAGVKLNDFVYYTRSGTAMTYTTMTVTGTIPTMVWFGMVGNADIGIIQNEDDFYLYERTGATAIRVTSLTVSGSFTARTNAVMVGDDKQGIIATGFTVPPAESAVLDDVIAYRREGTTLIVRTQSKSGALPGRREAMGAGDHTGMILFGGDDANSTRDDFLTLNRWESGLTSSVDDITSSTINNLVVPSAPTAVTATTLTKTGDSISGRWGHVMAGDEKRGIIIGGSTATAPSTGTVFPPISSLLSDCVRYEVNDAGTEVALTNLTKSGDSLPAAYAMCGSGGTTAGLLALGRGPGTNPALLTDYTNGRVYTADSSGITFSNLTRGGTAFPSGTFGNTVGGTDFLITDQGTSSPIRGSVSGSSILWTAIRGGGGWGDGAMVADEDFNRLMSVAGSLQDGGPGLPAGVDSSASSFLYNVRDGTRTIVAGAPSPTIGSPRGIGDTNNGVLFGGLWPNLPTATPRRYLGESRNTFFAYRRLGTTSTSAVITAMTLTGTVAARHFHTMKGDISGGLIFGGLSRIFTGVGMSTTSALNDFVRFTTGASPSHRGLTTSYQQITSGATTNDSYYTVGVVDDRGILSPSLGDSITIRGSDIGTSANAPTRLILGISDMQHIEFYRQTNGHLQARRGSGIHRFNTVRVIKHA